MKGLFRKFRYGEKGFTLIELLVVVAILGVLAAVAVPNVGKFINQGKKEAKETELHNIQTGVMALLADSVNGTMVEILQANATTNMSMFRTVDSPPFILRDYLQGLNADGTLKTYAKNKCRYYVSTMGEVGVVQD